MKAKRKYVRELQSMQSFIEPLPTEKLVWLAKAALEEVAKRMRVPQRISNAGPDVETRLHPSGRTLR